jgi:hypothetical protein
MTNTNCLDAMQCPNCRSFEPFKIAVKTIMKVFDNGTDDHGDTEWDADSYCECCECGFFATVADFSKTSPEAEALTDAPEQKIRDEETNTSASSPERLLNALSRASFLLRRIYEGDHNALKNALDCAEEADAIIAGVTGGAT